jgi:hypothetical protein
MRQEWLGKAHLGINGGRRPSVANVKRSHLFNSAVNYFPLILAFPKTIIDLIK